MPRPVWAEDDDSVLGRPARYNCTLSSGMEPGGSGLWAWNLGVPVFGHGTSRVPARATLCRYRRTPVHDWKGHTVGSVIKKRRKRMAKKKHRKLLKKTRIQRRRAGK